MWPGPSVDGLGPRLALNKPCHPRIRDWHSFAMPVTDAMPSGPSADGMGPRLAPNKAHHANIVMIPSGFDQEEYVNVESVDRKSYIRIMRLMRSTRST